MLAQPWEKRNATGDPSGYARAYSGGVWWVPDDGVFKMWHGCGISSGTDSCLGLCLATSPDGIQWHKPLLDVVSGTNVVINTPLKSNNVWFDPDDRNASRRYKLADSGGTDPVHGFAWSYRLWSSADGVHWYAAVGCAHQALVGRGAVHHPRDLLPAALPKLNPTCTMPSPHSL